LFKNMNDEENNNIKENDSGDHDVVIEKDDTLDDSVVAEENAAETIKKLKDKLRECALEKQKNLDGWQRTTADFLNFKKQTEESQKEFLTYAKEAVLGDILPVLDSFEMAMNNKEQWEKVSEEWRKGVEYIYSQLAGILSQHGMEQSTPKKGDDFDPRLHTAVGNVAVQDQALDHKVVEIVQKGYLLNGKIVRAANVVVGKYGEND